MLTVQNRFNGKLFFVKDDLRYKRKTLAKWHHFCGISSCRRPRQQRKAGIFLNVGQRADPGEKGKESGRGVQSLQSIQFGRASAAALGSCLNRQCKLCRPSFRFFVSPEVWKYPAWEQVAARGGG